MLIILTGAAQIRTLLERDPIEHQAHFSPFDAESIEFLLVSADKDRYWGIYDREHQDGLLGFFFLRGFDEGYTRPSFGVYIGAAHTRKGLATLALHYAMSWCKLRGIKELRLTVAPTNYVARGMYQKAGFVRSGWESEKGHLEYVKEL